MNASISEGDEIISKSAEDLTKILHIDQSNSIEAASNSIEDILTRLDELYGMLDMLRNDSQAIEQELPKLNEQIAMLIPLFNMINELEGFVEIVKKDVNEMEKQIKLAKTQYGSINSFKREIGSRIPFFGTKKNTTKEKDAMDKYHLELEIPVVFSTDNYFNK